VGALAAPVRRRDGRSAGSGHPRGERLGPGPAEVRQRILSAEALRAATTALRLYLGNHPRGPFDV